MPGPEWCSYCGAEGRVQYELLKVECGFFCQICHATVGNEIHPA